MTNLVGCRPSSEGPPVGGTFGFALGLGLGLDWPLPTAFASRPATSGCCCLGRRPRGRLDGGSTGWSTCLLGGCLCLRFPLSDGAE